MDSSFTPGAVTSYVMFVPSFDSCIQGATGDKKRKFNGWHHELDIELSLQPSIHINDRMYPRMHSE